MPIAEPRVRCSFPGRRNVGAVGSSLTHLAGPTWQTMATTIPIRRHRPNVCPALGCLSCSCKKRTLFERRKKCRRLVFAEMFRCSRLKGQSAIWRSEPCLTCRPRPGRLDDAGPARGPVATDKIKAGTPYACPPCLGSACAVRRQRLGRDVEAVGVHDLDPRRHKVAHELLSVPALGIDFGSRAQLRI